MLSVPMQKANDKKWERIGILAVLVGGIVLAVTFWVVANWSKQYQRELPNNNKTIMEVAQ